MNNIFGNTRPPILKPQQSINRHTACSFKSEVLTTLADAQPSVLIIDMVHVETVDSHGLMALASALHAAQANRCILQLCRVSPAVRIILEVSRLDQVFDILDDHPALLPLAA